MTILSRGTSTALRLCVQTPDVWMTSAKSLMFLGVWTAHHFFPNNPRTWTHDTLQLYLHNQTRETNLPFQPLSHSLHITKSLTPPYLLHENFLPQVLRTRKLKMSETPQPQDSPEQPPSEPGERPHFSRSLSSANFSPNGDLYDSLDDDWLLSTETGELTLFDFLDSFSVVPQTLDKLNQRFKLQSQGVPYFISGWRDVDVCV